MSHNGGDYETKFDILPPDTYAEVTLVSDEGEGETVVKSLEELRGMSDIAGLVIEELNTADALNKHGMEWLNISDMFFISAYSMTYAEAVINESATSEIVGTADLDRLRLSTEEYMIKGCTTMAYFRTDYSYNGVFEWCMPVVVYRDLGDNNSTSIGRLLLEHRTSLDDDNKCELLMFDMDAYAKNRKVLKVKYYVPADIMVKARDIYSDKLVAEERAVTNAKASKWSEYMSKLAEEKMLA